MTMILDGKAAAKEVQIELQKDVEALISKGIMPKLVVIQVGEDPASSVYIRNKKRFAGKIGAVVEHITLPENITEKELMTVVEQNNKDTNVHGIIVQVPLPKHINTPKILNTVDAKKDVDGFTDINLGKIMSRSGSGIPSCTPAGIMHLLHVNSVPIKGRHAVVVSDSVIVGRPLAMMLINSGATVTVCHKNTGDKLAVAAHTKRADIVVVGVGVKGFLTKDMVKQGATVVDVGIHRIDDGLRGDADHDELQDHAGAMTPVPGGVGPMTVAILLKNTINAAKILTE